MECGDGMCYTVRVGEVVRGGEKKWCGGRNISLFA